MPGVIGSVSPSISTSPGRDAPAIVLDGDQRSALAVTRSLGRRGIPVWVADSTNRPLASVSKYACKKLKYPDPAASPDQFLVWLEELDAQHPNSVLFPLTDITVPLTLRATSRIQSLRTALPSATAYRTASEKGRLIELANAAGVRTPRTWSITTANRNTLPQSLNFPVVVKSSWSAKETAHGIIKRPVRYALSQRELTSIVDALLLDSTDELLIQEYIDGSGAGIFALYDHSTPKFFFSHRRLRERPPSGGVSVLSESAYPPEEGIAAARRLLDRLNWHGVAMVEFKLDCQGRLWLIEINARLWGSLQLAIDCGADFPWWLYQQALGLPVNPPPDYEVGRRLRWWLGDLDNLYARLRDPQLTPTLGAKANAIGKFLLPWSPRTHYELLRWHDPVPGLVALWNYVAALRGRNS